MNSSKYLLPAACGFAITLLSSLSQAQLSPEITTIQTQWAKVSYQTPEDERGDAMKVLVERCDSLFPEQTRNAEALIWCGIVRSTYAGMASPFSAMKYAKGARSDLESAIDIDDQALSGSAYTSLGTLYFKVPGWPVGFGSKDKARDYLERGLAINETGIDSNYFYGEFLFEQGELEKARTHLVQASNATPRADRPVADEGRQAEIALLLKKIDAKLDDK
ncbi:MAG: hypothetical protein V7754_06655 [Halioglobus sp.]